jgi:hypothetical protein
MDNALSWDPIKSASLHSQFAGVLAGVAFVAMTLVLTRDALGKRPSSHWLTRAALTELLIAFLALSVASLEWGIIAGESIPASVRPGAAGVFATITLAIGALQMISGVSYLVLDYELDEPGKQDCKQDCPVTYTCAAGYAWIAVLAAFHIVLTTTDVLTRGLEGDEFPPNSAWYAAPIVVAVAMAVLTVWKGAPLTEHLAAVVKDSHRTASGVYTKFVTAVIVGGVIAFSLTINASTDSPLATLDGWTASAGVIAYLVGVTLVAILAFGVIILQGVLIRIRMRQLAEEMKVPHDTPSGGVGVA